MKISTPDKTETQTQGYDRGIEEKCVWVLTLRSLSDCNDLCYSK